MEIESIQTIIFQYIYLCIVSGVYMGLQNQLEQNFSSVNHNFYLLNSSHVKVILTEPSALRHYQGQIQTSGCRGGGVTGSATDYSIVFHLIGEFCDVTALFVIVGKTNHWLSAEGWIIVQCHFQARLGLNQ